MKRNVSLLIIVFFCLSATVLIFNHTASAGDTWDKIKRKTRDTSNITKLKMKKSKYDDKIENEYTKLGDRVYNDGELR